MTIFLTSRTSNRWTWRIWRCTWQPTLVRRSSVVYVVSGWGVWRTLFWNLNSAWILNWILAWIFWILNWILAWIFRCVADHLRTVHKQGKQKPCSQVLLSLSWVWDIVEEHFIQCDKIFYNSYDRRVHTERVHEGKKWVLIIKKTLLKHSWLQVNLPRVWKTVHKARRPFEICP